MYTTLNPTKQFQSTTVQCLSEIAISILHLVKEILGGGH